MISLGSRVIPYALIVTGIVCSCSAASCVPKPSAVSHVRETVPDGHLVPPEDRTQGLANRVTERPM